MTEIYFFHASTSPGLGQKKSIMEYSCDCYLKGVSDSVQIGKYQKGNTTDLYWSLPQFTYQRYLNRWPNSACLSHPSRYLLKPERQNHSLRIPSNPTSETTIQTLRPLHRQSLAELASIQVLSILSPQNQDPFDLIQVNTTPLSKICFIFRMRCTE